MMEEDIDIEEHDVLDNPRIRDIFPDLSRVKDELDSDDENQEQETFEIQIKQEYSENLHYDDNLGDDGNDDPTYGNSEPDDGNNEPDDGNNDPDEDKSDPTYGNEEFLPGNIDSMDGNAVFNDGKSDPSDGQNDSSHGTYELTDGNNDTYPVESQVYPTNIIKLGKFKVGKSDPNNGKIDLTSNSGFDNSIIILSDSDVNDNLDLGLNTDNIIHDENVENEGDDEAETSETEQDDESVQNNKKRYTILRQLLTEDNDYMIPNKIILGSKKKGKEYQKAMVLLEDWGQKLAQSGCFCSQCEILFETPNALDYHTTTCHSFLIAVSHNKAIKSTAKSPFNFARKSTSTKEVSRTSTSQNSKFCHHCNMIFPDDTSLIKHLYELVPNKQFSCILCKMKFNSQNELAAHNLTHRAIPKLVKGMNNFENIVGTKIPKFEPVEKSSNDDKFKCKICFEILDNYWRCKRHRQEKHPNLANKCIFVKIKSKPKSNLVVLKNDQDISMAKRDDIECKVNHFLMPKSTLFQCKICKLHFLSGLNAVLHKVCNIIKSFWICTICNRRFRNEDKIIHRKQHEYNSKFRVYFIVPDLYHKILCRCPDCNLHFEEKVFKAHFKNCPNIPSDECKTCNILVPKTRLIEHTKKHYYLNLKPKDFILMTYWSENNLKRKISDGFSNTPAKKRKLNFQGNNSSKIRLMYCQTCQCCMKKTQSTHVMKTCAHTTKLSIVCRICGLNFTCKSINPHMTMHEERPLTVKDFEIINLDTNEVINPPIPNYPQCQKCKIIFFRAATKRGHICGEDYDTCNICGDMYHSSNLPAHVLFHETPKKEVKNIELHNNEVRKPESQKKDVKIMPELLKKYELLNPMWNILFHCNICNVLTDSYDKCVEHSQAHINKQNITEQTIKCYICNMKFYESCWSKHAELHSQKKITHKDFKILNFDPKKLLTESWFQIFESLPEKETSQIIESSVYGHERAVKMKLNKPGRSEFTLYICSHCSICIEQTDIQNHIEGVCTNPELICEICDICFSDEISLAQHEDLHAKGINKDEFRIVSFEVKRLNEHKTYTLYKCNSCGACVTLRKSLQRHTCPIRKGIYYCELCQQSFVYQAVLKHEARHRLDPNFRAENTKIVPFDPRGQKESIGGNKFVSKSVKPPLNFKLKMLENIEMATETKDTKSDSKIEVYKCVKCKVCFLFKLKLEKHVCIPAKKRFTCKKCKQMFPTCTTPRHQARHRNNANFQAKNLRIIDFSLKNNRLQFYENTDDKLFKRTVNKSKDISLNESVSSKVLTNSTSKNSKDTPSSKIFYNVSGETSNNKKYKFYKCIDCNSCVSKHNHIYHKCIIDQRKHYCDICDIYIFKRYRLSHNQNHEDDPDFNSDNIEIIEFKRPQGNDFEGESRLDSDFEMKFESYESENESIQQQSLSNETRKLFKCEDCNLCLCTVQKHNINKHCCVTDDKKAFCDICQEYIHTNRIKSHQIEHREKNLGRENFTVINFKSRKPLISKKLTFESENVENENESIINNYKSTHIKVECDDESENTQDLESESIKDFENESENYDESQEIDIEDDDGVEDKLKLYKCTNCNICIHWKGSIEGHTCRIKPSSYFCCKCKQKFSKTMLKVHKLKHTTNKNLIASKIKIVRFKPLKVKRQFKISSWQRGELPKRRIYKKKMENSDKIDKNSEKDVENSELDVENSAKDVKNSAKIFKCDCGLHFTSEKHIKEHLQVCNENLEISKENCSKCGLLFPTDILVSHLCKHHSKNIEIVVENYSKNLEESAENYSENLEHSLETVSNETLNENTDTEKTETAIDNKTDTLDTAKPEKSDTNEVKKTPDTKKKVDASTSETKKKIKADLYKCNDCNVYFMSQSTCYKHALYHKKLDPNTYIECKICHLQFSIVTLATHMRVHHTKAFDLEKKMVEIYYPVEKSAPRKELYCAGDKIQSLLVSSSNDG